MAKKSKLKNSDLEKIKSKQITEDILIDRTSALQDLLHQNIKCLYWIENHLLISLPKMIAAAGTTYLQEALEQHLAITAGHVARLENVFDLLDIPVIPKKSDALEGLSMDGEHIIEETIAGSEARNTGLIMAGLQVENYEITTYTGVIQLASKLGLDNIVDILTQTLNEEQEAADLLTTLAEA